jgi:hypothetical protein
VALGNIIKEFLVRIGYDIDKGSEKTFRDSIKSAGLLVADLGAAIEATAGLVVYSMVRMSEATEQFYFMSQRSGATIAGIKGMSYAAQQFGVTAAEMQGSIEGLGQFLRTNPMAKSFIEGRLKVSTTDALGKPRDTAAIMADMGKAFSSMPLYLANAYAAALGISERTVLAMRQGMGDYIKEYQGLLKRLGVDEEAGGRAAHALMIQVRGVEATMSILGDKILQLLGPRTATAIQNFRGAVEKNFDKIADTIALVAGWIIKAAEVIDHLVVRGVEGIADLYNAFQGLPPTVQHVIEVIGGLLAAFMLLNPATAVILALGSAILLIYDDYKTWKEGGKHFIDWDTWMPEIKAAIQEIKHFAHAFDSINESILGQSGLKTAMEVLLAYTINRFVPGIASALAALAGIPAIRALIIAYSAATALASLSHGMDQKYQTLQNIDDIVRNSLRSMLGLAPIASPHDPGGKTTSSATLGVGGIDTAKEGAAAFAFWKKKGFTDAGAAAMTAMEQRESGFNPGAVGDSGAAQGLFQWHSGRRAAIYEATGIDVQTADANWQREAMFQEMSRGLDKQAGQVYQFIKNTTDVGFATDMATRGIERPANMEAEIRARTELARGWWTQSLGAGAQSIMAGAKSISVEQNNHYHITGQDANGIATAVKGVHDTTNAQLTRNLTGNSM